MTDMDIVIVNTQPVPSSGKGAASVNRILSYRLKRGWMHTLKLS